jgi:hypothetical protein
MEKKFKETSILEDYSKVLAKNCITLGPSITPYIATVLFDGVSRCLGAIKNQNKPKAIIFRSMDHSFLAGAKVEYIAGDDPTSSRWDYSWTFYENDLGDIDKEDIIDASSNSLVLTYFESSATSLFKMKFQGADTCCTMITVMLEMIKSWVTENTTETEGATVTLDGVFTAMGEMVDGTVQVGLVPDGSMKVLIKDDVSLSN